MRLCVSVCLSLCEWWRGYVFYVYIHCINWSNIADTFITLVWHCQIRCSLRHSNISSARSPARCYRYTLNCLMMHTNSGWMVISTVPKLRSFNFFPDINFCSGNTTTYYTIQYNTIQYYTILYYTIQYNTTQYNTIQYNTIQHSTILYNTIQHSTILYNTIQYNARQYNTI